MEFLWAPPEQAGWLDKERHTGQGWDRRFFILKVSWAVQGAAQGAAGPPTPTHPLLSPHTLPAGPPLPPSLPLTLQGQVLFYFKSRTATSAAKLRGAIPLESAKIETEAPAAPAAGAQQRGRPQHVVTITLHASNALNCRHNFYTLAAPSAEVQVSAGDAGRLPALQWFPQWSTWLARGRGQEHAQRVPPQHPAIAAGEKCCTPPRPLHPQAAWVTALWQAAIPRSELINSLQQAGRLPELVVRYAEAVQQCYPVADAAVISAGGVAGHRAGLKGVGGIYLIPG